jgi:hypothetical protein
MVDKNKNILIHYDLLTISALRNVVKEVLKNVSDNKLPENHQFYITFDTKFENVKLPSILKEKYPNEMTIVIEHSFWELNVQDNFFSIILTFNDIKSKLTIPYKSLLVFSDPYANFHLKFPKLEYNKNTINKTDKNKENIINFKDFKKGK